MSVLLNGPMSPLAETSPPPGRFAVSVKGNLLTKEKFVTVRDLDFIHLQVRRGGVFLRCFLRASCTFTEVREIEAAIGAMDYMNLGPVDTESRNTQGVIENQRPHLNTDL